MKVALTAVLVAAVAVYYYNIAENLYLAYRGDVSNTAWDVSTKNSPKMATNSYMNFKMASKDRRQIGTENATIVMLVRNRDLEGALLSMRSLEDRFNREYKYPWVFLNDDPFDDAFMEETTLMASGETYYELIPREDWVQPDFIDESIFKKKLREYANEGVIYGGVRSYRNMCHFNSGYFFRQKKLLEYDWYFRVEPDVEYLCDFLYDPFKFLRENDMIYGFVTAIHEYENTIPTLWPTVEKFIQEYSHLIHPNNSIDFLTTNEPDLNQMVDLVNSSSRYNLCHFWSNFEIGNLNFWRSEEYLTFFDYLDRSGGFFYERWGDAPVHSIGLSLLADKHKIHHFDDIGYYHPPYMACPTSKDLRSSKRCICKTNGWNGEIITEPYDTQVFSCLSRWWRYGSGKKFLNEVQYTFG